MDKVTVGIPAYNSGKYIRESLLSILKQTYRNLEIIVVDNGSTDNTEEIVLSIKDPRVKFYKNPENFFCYGNYNVIIDLANTDFLAIYHSDDVYKPDIVAQQVEFLEKNREAMAVFTEAHVINSKGEIIGDWNIPEALHKVNLLDFKTGFNGFLKYGDFLICPSGMFRKQIFMEIGLFKDEKFFSTTQDEQWLELLKKYDMGSEMIFTANDLEMWLRILMKFHIGILHKKLMFYRVHAGQGTQQVQATSYENFFIVIDYYARYARTNNLILGKNWKCYEAKKVRWEFAKGMRALMRDEFSFARKFFMNFIKKFQLLVPDLKLKDFFRFLWAWCVIFSGPFAYKLKKTVHMYFLYKNRKENKKVRIF